MSNNDTKITYKDFVNKYEMFYKRMRMYLWPYPVLQDLAEVENSIFTAFPDLEELKKWLYKLKNPIKEACDEFDDEKFREIYEELVEMAEEADPDEMYASLYRVEEVNPDEDKQIKTEPDEEEDTEEDNNEFNFEPEEPEEGAGI